MDTAESKSLADERALLGRVDEGRARLESIIDRGCMREAHFFAACDALDDK